MTFLLEALKPNYGATEDENIALAFSFPEFDASNLYGVAGDVARIVSKNSEADPMAVYCSFLAMSAAMFGRFKYIQIGDTRHYARLYVALVGASSRARKGTSYNPVSRIIQKTEEIYLQRSNNPTLSSLVIADGGLSSAEGLIYQVRDQSEEKEGKGGGPLWDGVEDKRLLVVEEELANVLKISQREGNTLSPILRKAWDGGNLAPMTKNNRLKSSDPHINLLSHITQFELKQMMAKADLHNGLANRFLWVSVRRTRKLAFPQPMADDDVLKIANRLSKAFMKSVIPEAVSFTSEARYFWVRKYYEVSTDKAGLIGSLTSRSEAHVMRLSLLFALLDGNALIDVRHVQAAIDLIDYCNESVKFIFTTPDDTKASSDADRLLLALARGPMTQTEVNKLFSGHKTRRDLSQMLSDLQALNKIKSVPKPGSKKIMWELK
ncbi:DUF3987 domain-containing protein [Methylomonas sp. MgM2]